MTVRERLLDFLKPRHETLEFSGQKIIVRELTTEDAEGGLDAADLVYQLLVCCCLDENRQRIFTKADIPALKAGSRGPIALLIEAVNRVHDDRRQELTAAANSGESVNA